MAFASQPSRMISGFADGGRRAADELRPLARDLLADPRRYGEEPVRDPPPERFPPAVRDWLAVRAWPEERDWPADLVRPAPLAGRDPLVSARARPLPAAVLLDAGLLGARVAMMHTVASNSQRPKHHDHRRVSRSPPGTGAATGLAFC
jgi:hypothetical protein